MLVSLVYTGPHDEVQLDSGDRCRRGQTVDVSAELAGRPPSGSPDAEGYDPGAGLLAQPDNWQPAPAATSRPRKTG